MAGDEPSLEDRSAGGPGYGGSSWEPYQSPQTGRGGVLHLLRRYSFSITVVVSALVVGALIYYSPTRLSPEQKSADPVSESRYSTLSVYSEPTGASVIVGADTIGVTPVKNHRVPSGAYLVSVRKEDYADRDTVIKLAADRSAVYTPRLRRDEESPGAEQEDPQELSTAEDFGSDPPQNEPRESVPDPNPESDAGSSSGASQEQDPNSGSSGEDQSDSVVMGSLALRSDPGGTSVEINGYGVGSTPMRLDQVAAGTHEVTFRHPGYETVTKRVEVTGNDTLTVEASLESLTGRLRVLVRPWGSIYINGERHAQDSDVWYVTELQAGTYTVTARHPSLGEQARTVQVAAGDTLSVVLNVQEN